MARSTTALTPDGTSGRTFSTGTAVSARLWRNTSAKSWPGKGGCPVSSS